MPLRRIDREEDQAGSVLAGIGEAEAQPLGLLLQEAMGRLQQDAGTVSGVGLATAGPAMLQVDQDLDGLADDVVRASCLEIDDEADSAGIVLVERIVQTLLAWNLGVHGTVLRVYPHSGRGKSESSADGRFRPPAAGR